ncbi:MAG: SH3 domain-containing protein [Chloroflexota bacterium]
MTQKPSSFKRRIVATALVFFCVAVLAAPALAGPALDDPVGTVNTARLNIRSAPSASASVVVVVDKGQGVSLFGRNTAATWVQVRLPSGITGWANKFYITTSATISSLPVTGDATPVAAGATALVATGRLNLRSAPDPYATVLAILDKNTSVTLIGRNTSGTWVQVKTTAGLTGWMKAAYLRYDIVISTLPVTGV